MGEVSVRKSDDGINHVAVEQGSSLLEQSHEEQIVFALHKNLNFAPESPSHSKRMMGASATKIDVNFDPFNDSAKIISGAETAKLKSTEGSVNTLGERKVFF